MQRSRPHSSYFGDTATGWRSGPALAAERVVEENVPIGRGRSLLACSQLCCLLWGLNCIRVSWRAIRIRPIASNNGGFSFSPPRGPVQAEGA